MTRPRATTLRRLLPYLVVGGIAVYSITLKAYLRDLPEAQAVAGPPDSGLIRDASVIRDMADTHRLVILYFWATWCAPCVESSPRLVASYESLEHRDVQVVAVSLDADRQGIESHLQRKPWPFVVVHDEDGKLRQRYSVNAVPEIVVLDPELGVVPVQYDTDAPDGLLEGIDAWLANSPSKSAD